jgi:hypothetical protein
MTMTMTKPDTIHSMEVDDIDDIDDIDGAVKIGIVLYVYMCWAPTIYHILRMVWYCNIGFGYSPFSPLPQQWATAFTIALFVAMMAVFARVWTNVVPEIATRYDKAREQDMDMIDTSIVTTKTNTNPVHPCTHRRRHRHVRQRHARQRNGHVTKKYMLTNNRT